METNDVYGCIVLCPYNLSTRLDFYLTADFRLFFFFLARKTYVNAHNARWAVIIITVPLPPYVYNGRNKLNRVVRISGKKIKKQKDNINGIRDLKTVDCWFCDVINNEVRCAVGVKKTPR